MSNQPPLRIFALLAGLAALLLLPASVSAQQGDELLFSASGGAAPNILILLDTSGSMGKAPSGCTDDCSTTKRTLASQSIVTLVSQVNPPDGDGGFEENARFGFGIFTKNGGRVMVPVGDPNATGKIID